MARKITYRAKREQQLAVDGTTPERKERPKHPPIDPEIQQPFLTGKMLLVDKPLHWTSFDVIRKLRGLLQIKKIGHAGTLDPLATGLLLVCTGAFTKKINELMAVQKEYTGTITLGAVTPTYDLESLPEQHKDYTFITIPLLEQTVQQFTGALMQKPPVYSAIKKDGVALYELARRGEDVDLQPRPVTIYQFEITGVQLPEVHFKVSCSTGTYIRSLAHDFGAALGCGGYLSALRRTKVGDYIVEDAQTVEQIEASLYPQQSATDADQKENG